MNPAAFSFSKILKIIPNLLLLLNFPPCESGINDKGVPLLLPEWVLDQLNFMQNIDIKDDFKFIRISLSSVVKYHLKDTHGILNRKVCESPLDLFLYVTIKLSSLLNLKYTNLCLLNLKKPSDNFCGIYLENRVCILNSNWQETRLFVRISQCSNYWRLRKNQEFDNTAEFLPLKSLFYKFWK